MYLIITIVCMICSSCGDNKVDNINNILSTADSIKVHSSAYSAICYLDSVQSALLHDESMQLIKIQSAKLNIYAYTYADSIEAVKRIDTMLTIIEKHSSKNSKLARSGTYSCYLFQIATVKKDFNIDDAAYYYAYAISQSNETGSCSKDLFLYSAALLSYDYRNYENALKYFKDIHYKNIGYSESFEGRYFKQEALNNIGLCYLKLKQYDSAHSYFNSAYNTIIQYRTEQRKTSWKLAEAITLRNIGDIWYSLKKTEESLNYYSKSFELIDNTVDSILNQQLIIKLTNNYFENNNYSKAKKIFSLINENQLVEENQLQYHSIKWKIKFHEKQYIEAIRSLQKYNKVSDSINNSIIRSKYDNINNTVSILLKEKKLLEQDRNLKNTNKILILFVFIGLLLLIIALLLYKNISSYKKTLVLLEEKNSLILIEKEELQNAINTLNYQLLKNDFIIRSITHDILSPLTTAYANLEYLELTNNWSKNSDETVSDMKNALNKAMNFSKELTFNKSSYELKEERININIIVKECVNDIKYLSEPKNIRINIITEANTSFVKSNSRIIKSVLSNLLHNAIKFSFKKDIIQVIVNQADTNTITISVQDTGVGIPEYLINKLFEDDSTKCRKGTNNEASHGQGLYISYRLTKIIGGELYYKPNSPNGSNFTISLPVNN